MVDEWIDTHLDFDRPDRGGPPPAPGGTQPLRSPARGTYTPPARRQPIAVKGPEPSKPAHPHLVLTRRGRRVALESIAMLASTALVALLPSSLQATGPWSQPAALASCSAPGAPAVVFPSDEPRHATGPGAIVWGAGAGCAGGAAGVRVSAIAPGVDAPGAATPASEPGNRPLALSPPIAAQAAPHGQLLLAGTGRSQGSAGEDLTFAEGVADRQFTAPQATGGDAGPLALSSAYLGDVALVSPGGADAHAHAQAHAGDARPLELRVHRYYARAFSPPVAVTGAGPGAGPGAGRVESAVVAMDYRSDALVVWQRSGAIYARDMPGAGRSSRGAARVASADTGAHIAALLSDDNRAILAWSETRAGVTSVYAELSATGPRFGAPRLLERFSDPGGHPPPGDSGAPRLVRLSSESVMLAWSGAGGGRWVVHTAAIDEHGVRAIATISQPGRAALLDDLAPGPDGEAYALWSEPRPAPSGDVELEYGDQALYAARGVDAYPGQTIFASPQLVAAAGAEGTSGEAAVGVDPDSDRAIAAWRTSGGAIDYSLRALGVSG